MGQHQKTMFSSLSRSAKSLSVTTTIQKLSSSRRSVVDKKVFSKTPATTSPVAAILRTARVVRAESGDGVVTVAEPKENGSTEDDDVSPSAVQQRAKAAIDPADGSVAEAAPLGDDSQLLDDAVKVFSDATAVEMINGRVAQIGWMAALY